MPISRTNASAGRPHHSRRGRELMKLSSANRRRNGPRERNLNYQRSDASIPYVSGAPGVAWPVPGVMAL